MSSISAAYMVYKMTDINDLCHLFQIVKKHGAGRFGDYEQLRNLLEHPEVSVEIEALKVELDDSRMETERLRQEIQELRGNVDQKPLLLIQEEHQNHSEIANVSNPPGVLFVQPKREPEDSQITRHDGHAVVETLEDSNDYGASHEIADHVDTVDHKTSTISGSVRSGLGEELLEDIDVESKVSVRQPAQKRIRVIRRPFTNSPESVKSSKKTTGQSLLPEIVQCQLCNSNIRCDRSSASLNHLSMFCHAKIHCERQFSCPIVGCDITKMKSNIIIKHLADKHPNQKHEQPIDNWSPELSKKWDAAFEECFPERQNNYIRKDYKPRRSRRSEV